MNNKIIHPVKFNKQIKEFHQNFSENDKENLIYYINELHKELKNKNEENLENILKIEYILPEFRDLLEEGYTLYKNNALHHKEIKAKKKKENAKKWILIKKRSV